LAGNLLNSTSDVDFVATPRGEKSADFVYRMNLFQLPQIEVGGIRFQIHDVSKDGYIHRADVSARELSDAAITSKIIRAGAKYCKSDNSSNSLQYISAVIIRNPESQQSVSKLSSCISLACIYIAADSFVNFASSRSKQYCSTFSCK